LYSTIDPYNPSAAKEPEQHMIHYNPMGQLPKPEGYWSRKVFNKTDVQDQRVLAGLVPGRKLIVEVGTFTGGTAECMLEHMDDDARLITIDPYIDLPKVNFIDFVRREVITVAASRLEKFGDRVTQIIGDSKTIAPLFADGTVDMVFIDGDHRYEGVKADILGWMPKLKKDGVMSGHDFDQAAMIVNPRYIDAKKDQDRDAATGIHCGVAWAVNELFSSFHRDTAPTCTIWWSGWEHFKQPTGAAVEEEN
jgi:predicted O-methyltransferase YrrM